MPAAEKEQYFGARQGKNLERPASVVVDRLFDDKVVIVNKGRRQIFFYICICDNLFHPKSSFLHVHVARIDLVDNFLHGYWLPSFRNPP